MIRRIRRKFIAIALTVLALSMVLLALVINVANWVNVRTELSATLDRLSEAGGRYGAEPRMPLGGMRPFGPRIRLDESRFFSVVIDKDGNMLINDRSREPGASAVELKDVADRALKSGRDSGFSGAYFYRSSAQADDQTLMVFLNCETRIAAARMLATLSAAACALGILMAWLLVSLFSRRAIRPLIENAVRQKQFITDAGHELKTPLTVISANMDVLQLETGENEWVRSTQKQVNNMRGLVNELIYLSRLDEEDSHLQMVEFDLSRALSETAEPFEGMAEFRGKALRVDAGSGIRMVGDENAVRRLISVLCDNAVKYAPEDDVIEISLTSDGRRVTLTAENATLKPIAIEQLDHLFDRFYRADASRAKGNGGGYGIGLSVARAIAEKHGGEIRARLTDAGRLRFTATLPAVGRRKKAQDNA